jgi:metal-responsive CopG/Arc/MetJ family transcriptional regulator
VTKKTAISLPDDLFREIERARKRSKKDRSTWIQEAASDYLKRKTMQEKVEAYFEGYRRVPDGEDAASIALEKAWLEDASWEDEDWPEADDVEAH